MIYKKNQQIVILNIVGKPWCDVACWSLLPLLSDYHDYLVMNVVEKFNWHFCVWFKG